MPSRFETRCGVIADAFGLSDVLFCRGENYQPPFEDDGCLHIVSRSGTRAVFDVSQGQSLPGQHQNEIVRAVMSALKLKVTDRVLVEEEECESDECSYCGR